MSVNLATVDGLRKSETVLQTQNDSCIFVCNIEVMKNPDDKKRLSIFNKITIPM